MSADRELPETLDPILPTNEEREKSLKKIYECLPFWLAEPAMLIIKPTLGLIVSLQKLEHDDMGYTLTVDILETLYSPENPVLPPSMKLGCFWNQPYLSIARDCLSAPYSFYLHFGREGVQAVRQSNEVLKRKNAPPHASTLGILRFCFRHGFDPDLFSESG
jgi:hypothetical protein